MTDSHEVIKEVLAKQLDNENDTDVNSDTGVIEAPMTAFDTQAIDISIVPGEMKRVEQKSTLLFLKRADEWKFGKTLHGERSST